MKTMKAMAAAATMTLLMVSPITAQEAAQADGLKVGNFSVINTVDEFGKVIASARTVGEKGTTLMWVCTPGRAPGVQLGWAFDQYMAGRRGKITIMYRFGQDSARDTEWDIAGSHKGAFVPTSRTGTADPLLVTTYARMAQWKGSGGEKLLIRAVDTDGESVTETFTLTELDLALAHLPCSEAAGMTNAGRDELLKAAR